MTSRSRRNSLARKRPTLQPRGRLLIVCEGKITEPRYFEDLRHENRNRLVSVKIEPNCGVPKSVVGYARTLKRQAEQQARRMSDSYLKYDQVWCVFDIDTHPNVTEAKQQAHDNGILVAVSNPCFELWILLHFQDQSAPEHHHAIQNALRNYLPDYEKEVPYDRVRELVEDALRRARDLDQWQENRENSGGNPSTGVYHLVERIREFGKEQFLRQASNPRT